MRFEKGHKEKTRQKIVETAAKCFRRDGVAATGINGLMEEAGLTHGGFYAHFRSKEDLVREAMEVALAENRERRAALLAEVPDGEAMEALVRFYLRPAHRDAPERGCAAASLISEIARHEPETRAAFGERLDGLLGQIGAALPKALGEEERRRRAIGIFATLMGALQMARAVTGQAASEEILQSGVQAALALAGHAG